MDEAARVLFFASATNNDLKKRKQELSLGLDEAKAKGDTALADKYRAEIADVMFAANQRRLAGTWS